MPDALRAQRPAEAPSGTTSVSNECRQKCRAPLTTTPERVRARPGSALPATPECACRARPVVDLRVRIVLLSKPQLNRPQRRWAGGRGTLTLCAVAAAKFTRPGISGRAVASPCFARCRFRSPPRSPSLAGCGTTVASGRRRRRHDGARQAALRSSIPGAVDRLAARLPQGSAVDLRDERQDDDRRDGRARSSRRRVRLAHNSSGANLVSGVASTLLDARDAELGLFEVDEGALPEIAAAGPAAGASASATSSATSSTATASSSTIAERWRAAVARASGETALVVNGDDPQVGDLARGAPGRVVFGVDDPAPARARRSSTPPTRSTACAAARRTSTRPPTSGTSATTAARAAGTRARRSTSSRARSSCDGLEAVVVRPRHARRDAARAARPARALQRLQRARRRCARAARSARRSTRSRPGSSRFAPAFGRFERIAVGDRRLLLLLIKNPAGANEVVRTLVDGGAPRSR